LSTDLELAKAIREIPELTEHQTKGKARDSYKKLQSQAQAIIAMDNLSDEDKSALQQMMATSSAGVSYDTQASDAEKPALAGDHTHQEVPDEAKPLLAKHVPAESDESLPKFIYEICNFKDLLPKLPDEMIGFVEVDPPYAINFNSVYGQTQQIEAKAQDWTLEEFQDNMAILLNNIKRKLLSESWLLLWIGAEHEEWVQDLAVKLGYGIQPAGFWTKPSGGSNTPSTTMIHNYEKFLLLRHGNARFNIPSVKAAMEFNPVPNQERYHQWQKPLEMYQYFIRACGRPGSLFFSPFAGSGTSMIAAAQGGMIPVGCDTTKKYFYRFYATYKEYCYDPGKTTSQEDPDLHMLPREISAD
jgi:DNA modification methylase